MKTSKSSLGSIAKIASHAQETAKERAFRLQDYAARLLPEERVSKCLRAIAPNAGGAAVMRVPSQDRAYYRNLITCNRVWECPVCAARITSARRDELSAALALARQRGWTPIMVTYTLRHSQADKLAALLDGLLKAVRAFKSGREWQDIKIEYGIVGSIRSLEVTYGLPGAKHSGWHPHCHELMFLAPMGEDGRIIEQSPTFMAGLRNWLKERWQHVAKLQGWDASYEHGLDVIEADSAIAEYVAKYGHEPLGAGWTASDDLARSPVKRGRHEDRKTPFQLLELYGTHGDKQAGALFVEYAEAFKGRNQLVWSRGLRELLGMAEETSDIAITDESNEAVEVAFLLPEAWSKIVISGNRGTLLKVAATGDKAALSAWLAQYQIRHYDLTQYSMPARK